jgi:hypothetical protein
MERESMSNNKQSSVQYWSPSQLLCTCVLGVMSTMSLGVVTTVAYAQEQQTPVSVVLPTRIYGNDSYPVPYRKAMPNDAPRARYTGFHPGSQVLKKGTVRREGALALPCDIIFDRDVQLTMRDGTNIYTDVFRPAMEGRYPGLVGWSPYGKEIGGQWLDDIRGRSGVPLERVSELQRFEGPDPAFWTCNGYVVLNPDPRGVSMSEGNISYWGRQMAEDGYDFIEWAAKQPWSNGNLGMAGNSWLAVSQWFIAAEQPPHLAAIAPWEGFSDHFRDASNRGGIPMPQFPEMIIQTLSGNGLIEDQPRMIIEQQFMTPYWEGKKARLERIKIPAYVVASFTNGAHTHGTFEGFRQISSGDKWLRVHNNNEWQDFHTPENEQDLLKFFNHYLKGVDNGWERTPKVRLSVLDPGRDDIVNRVEEAWPLARTKFRKLYLDGSKNLRDAGAGSATQLSNDANTGETNFTYTFDKDTELTGYMKLRLWVEAEGNDDMELAVGVEKLDKDGKELPRLQGEGRVAPVVASGFLRVSQRALDPSRSTESEPYLLNDREEKLSPKQIVPVDISIWPVAMLYHAGEKLKLTVAAYRPLPDMYIGFGAYKVPVPANGGTFTPGTQVPMLQLGGTPDTSPAYVKAQQVKAPEARNRGRHILHVGGKYDSYLLVPEIPAGK